MKSLTRRRQQLPEAPAPVYTQDQLRQRRRQGFFVEYRADFDLAAEVGAIVAPLAAQVAVLKRPLAVRRRADLVADAVHEVLSAVVGMLAESRHLDPAADARTRQAIRDLAQRPREPQISDDDLTSGRWATVLVDFVAPYRDDLAALLGRARQPGHPDLKGGLSVSERLEQALRNLDHEARYLERLIPKVAAHQALPTPEEINARNRDRAERERAERTLSKMTRRPAP